MVLGADLALRSSEGSPLLAVGLLAAGLALGGRGGLATSALALGLLSVWVRPGTCLERFERERVVAVEGLRLMPWRRDTYGWSAPVRLRRVAQGERIELVRSKLWLALGAGERPPAGRRIRAQGYLVRVPTLHNGGRVERRALRLRVKSPRLAVFSGPHDRWLESVRALGSDRASGSDGIALARALALGERSAMSPGLVRAFRRAGLGHLLALSGLHVGILAGIGVWLARLWLGRLSSDRWLWLVPGLACGLFLVIAGPRPAVLRASLMALSTWAALARGSRPLSSHALVLIVAGMVAIEPERLRELSFQLTVAATAGILWQIRAGGVRAGLGSTALRVSAAAQLFTLPWSLPAFHLLAPAALVHNLWAVPWTALCLVLGLSWLAVAALSPAVARSTEGLLEIGAVPFEWIGRLPAGPWWSIPVAVSGLEATLLALGCTLLLRRPVVAMLAATGLVALGGVIGDRSLPDDPEVIMLDVGQGEAILLRDGSESALVDGGGWTRGDLGGRVLVPALARLGVRRLGAVVLTHPDLDHCGGLVSLAAYMPVGELWTPAGWPPGGCLLDLISMPGVGWRPVWAGWRGQVGRWRLRALSPPPADRTAGNDRSLVLSARARGFGVLLTGDIESRAERALLVGGAGESLRADLLKVPHHGSRTSSGAALIEAVGPRLAWISAGVANRYRHPHPAVVRRLEARGVRILRTDRDGLIRLRVDSRGAVHLALPGSPK